MPTKKLIRTKCQPQKKSHGQNANLGWHFVRLAFCPHTHCKGSEKRRRKKAQARCYFDLAIYFCGDPQWMNIFPSHFEEQIFRSAVTLRLSLTDISRCEAKKALKSTNLFFHGKVASSKKIASRNAKNDTHPDCLLTTSWIWPA